MRHVYPSDQVIHIWAHQSQDEARNGSNVRFNGPLLYSYNTVIAQLETDATGQTWAFLSDSSLTPTTGKHVSASRNATRHMPQFYTPAFSDHWQGHSRTPEQMINSAIEQATDDLKEAFRPRKRATTKADIIAHYEARRRDIQEVRAAFNLPAANMPDVDPATAAQWTASAKLADIERKEAARLRAERQAAKEADRRERDQEQFAAWLTTGAGSCPHSFKQYGADLLTISGDEVTTSQGARAPLGHVKRALTFYDSRRNGQTWTPYHTNGHKIPLGHFTLDSIDEAGNVKAGCHTFSAAEIARFKTQWSSILTSQGAIKP